MLKKLILDQNIDVNRILLDNYVKLGLNENEVIMLMNLFLLYGKNKLVLSFNGIKSKMTLNSKDISETFDSLISKGFLEITSELSKSGKEQERFDLMPALNQIAKIYIADIEEANKSLQDKTMGDLVLMFEEHLARSLSPIELSILEGLTENGYSFSEIKKAFEEAVSVNKVTLKYVEAILRGKEDNVVLDENHARAIDEFYKRLTR